MPLVCDFAFLAFAAEQLLDSTARKRVSASDFFFAEFSTIFTALSQSILNGVGFEQTLVEYEVDTMTSEVDAILEAEYPGIVILLFARAAL